MKNNAHRRATQRSNITIAVLPSRGHPPGTTSPVQHAGFRIRLAAPDKRHRLQVRASPNSAHERYPVNDFICFCFLRDSEEEVHELCVTLVRPALRHRGNQTATVKHKEAAVHHRYRTERSKTACLWRSPPVMTAICCRNDACWSVNASRASWLADGCRFTATITPISLPDPSRIAAWTLLSVEQLVTKPQTLEHSVSTLQW